MLKKTLEKIIKEHGEHLCEHSFACVWCGPNSLIWKDLQEYLEARKKKVKWTKKIKRS